MRDKIITLVIETLDKLEENRLLAIVDPEVHKIYIEDSYKLSELIEMLREVGEDSLEDKLMHKIVQKV